MNCSITYRDSFFSIDSDDHQARAFRAVAGERLIQDSLKERGKFEKTCADAMTNEERLAVLAEEFGEVARAILEGDHAGLQEGLAQVAAVSVAWLEGLDREVTDDHGADT